MKTRFPFVLIIFAVLVLVLPGGPTSAVQDTEEDEAGAAEFEQFIELERAVHFLNPTGEDVIVSPGAYSIQVSEGALQLIPDNEQTTQPITIQAEATTHDESLEIDRPVSASVDTDKHVVALLLSNGKAFQAIGSYSGVHARGFKLKPGFLKGVKLPTITAIWTTPQLGALTPGGKLYIKGNHFGSSKGKIILHGSFWVSRSTALKVETWSPTKITATVPRETLGKNVRDQHTKFQIKSAKGVGGIAWKIRFRAARQSRWIDMNDKAVKVVSCSAGADANQCNNNLFTAGSEKCSFMITPTWENRNPAIFSFHHNCGSLVDFDEGTDRYAITLKNGWVFKKFKLFQKKSSPSEKIRMPSYSRVNKWIGLSSWSPKIRWETSAGNNSLSFGYYVQIEGPNGIPHY